MSILIKVILFILGFILLIVAISLLVQLVKFILETIDVLLYWIERLNLLYVPIGIVIAHFICKNYKFDEEKTFLTYLIAIVVSFVIYKFFGKKLHEKTISKMRYFKHKYLPRKVSDYERAVMQKAYFEGKIQFKNEREKKRFKKTYGVD